MLLASFLSLLTNAPIGILIADLIGAVQFAIYAEFLLFTTTLSFAVYFGLESLIVKYLANSDELETIKIFQTIIVIRIAVFILASTVIMSVLGTNLVPYLLVAMMIDVFYFAQQHYEAELQFIKLAKIRILTIIVISILRVSALVSGIIDPKIYISLFVFEKIVFILLLFLKSRTLQRSIIYSAKTLPSRNDIQYFLSESLYIFISAMTYFLYTRVDQYILVIKNDTIALANYSLSVRLIEATFFLPAILSSIFMAKISKKDMSYDHKYDLSIKEIRILLILAIFSIICCNLCAKILDYYLLKDFKYFLNYTTIYSFLIPAIFVYNILKKIAIYLGLYTTLMTIMIMSLIMNLVLSIIAYNYVGAIGLLYATVFTFYFTSIYLTRVCYHNYRSMKTI